MNKEIRLLLCELLRNEHITASWGITAIRISENSVAFNVSGFLYKGRIAIKSTTDGYSIALEDLPCIKASAGTIVETLDRVIEAGDGYLTQIASWIDCQHKPQPTHHT